MFNSCMVLAIYIEQLNHLLFPKGKGCASGGVSSGDASGGDSGVASEPPKKKTKEE